MHVSRFFEVNHYELTALCTHKDFSKQIESCDDEVFLHPVASINFDGVYHGVG